MRIFQGFGDLPAFNSPVVTVGSFDGVHAGHRALLGEVTRIAREKGVQSVVVTFDPHPRHVLFPDEGKRFLLTTPNEKAYLLEELGIDNLIVAPFTTEFSRVSSRDFLSDFLIGKIGAGTLVVGYNHNFGYNKEGDFDYLDSLKRRFGFEVYRQPRQDVGADKVSSTVIRELIKKGDMSNAARYLGHPYIIITPEDAAKLIPPAGDYNVIIDGKEAVLHLDGQPITEKKDLIISFC